MSDTTKEQEEQDELLAQETEFTLLGITIGPFTHYYSVDVFYRVKALASPNSRIQHQLVYGFLDWSESSEKFSFEGKGDVPRLMRSRLLTKISEAQIPYFRFRAHTPTRSGVGVAFGRESPPETAGAKDGS